MHFWKSCKLSTKLSLLWTSLKTFLPWVWGHALLHSHICCRFPTWKIDCKWHWNNQIANLIFQFISDVYCWIGCVQITRPRGWTLRWTRNKIKFTTMFGIPRNDPKFQTTLHWHWPRSVGYTSVTSYGWKLTFGILLFYNLI